MGRGRVVYTCLFGGYETLLDQPVAASSDVEFIAFTDDPTLTSDTWQIRLVDPTFPADQNRSSRRPKILAHEYLEEFDESLYIDNSVLLKASPQEIFTALLPADTNMSLFAHSYRGPVRDEFKAVVTAGKDIDIICDEQLKDYERTAPNTLDLQTLWGGFLLRRHNDPAVRSAMQTWWEHVLRYSRRDQLSLPYALATSGLPHQVHQLDNRVSEYHVWPREGTKRDRAGGADPDLAAGLRKERAEAIRVKEQAEAEVAKLHASNSWRITRPLRALSPRALSPRARAARRSAGRGPR